jgi:hypothetical protein
VLDSHLHGDFGVRLVVHHLEVIEREVFDILNLKNKTYLVKIGKKAIITGGKRKLRLYFF